LVYDGVACGSRTRSLCQRHVKTFRVTEAYMREVGLDDDRSDGRRNRHGG